MTMTTTNVDRWRFFAPEGTFRPLPDPLAFPKDTFPVVDSSTLARHNTRFPEQLRPVITKLGLVTRAAGSVFWECGRTKLICNVHGPRNPGALVAIGASSGGGTVGAPSSKTFYAQGNITCEVAFAPFSRPGAHQNSYVPEAEEEDLARRVIQSLAPSIRRGLFPNATVDIHITVLEDDGGILAGAIMAASLALAQARIDTMDVVVAISLAWDPTNSVFIMDPDYQEERYRHHRANDDDDGNNNSTNMTEKGNEPDEGMIGKKLPLLTVAMMPNLGLMTEFNLVGIVDAPYLIEGLSLASDAIHSLYDSVIRPAMDTIALPPPSQS